MADAVVTGAERLFCICAFDFSAGEGANVGLEGVGELSGDGCGGFIRVIEQAYDHCSAAKRSAGAVH